MRHLKIFYLLLLPIFVISCGNFSEITIGDINDLSVKGFEENAMIVSLNLLVENPTLRKITVYDFDTKVFINNQYLGKATLRDPIILKAKSNEIHNVVFEIRLANIFGTALTLMNFQKGQKVLFMLDGNAYARTLLIRKKIEIKESREVTL
jgi:LEA14-like dessication related protein